jgi:phage tail-like protein
MSAQIDSTPAMLFLLNLGSFGTIGHFKEVSGIDHETEVIEDKKVLPDGKLATYRVAGVIKWSPIEMKRGIDTSGDLWKWRETVIQQGQAAARLDGEISLINTLGAPVATWKFMNGWPSKYTGAAFNANNNEVAMEGITIIHEGVERVL